MNKLFRFIPLLLLISGISFIPLTNVLADGENDTDKNEINISISPKDTLFDISNMKPGDWAPRTITVKNSGSKDFDYQMQLRNNGEEKLFNELLLEIKDGQKELYQGKLATFKSLPTRKLTTGSEENLDITIRFPEHLGNEFQGLLTAFDFIFTAEGKDSNAVQAMAPGQIDSGSSTSIGKVLPDTATNIFNLMLLGTVLVAGGIVMMIITYYRRMKLAQ